MLLIAYIFKHEGIYCASLEKTLNEIVSQVATGNINNFPVTLPACVFLTVLGKIDYLPVFTNVLQISPDVLNGESAAEFSMRLLSASGGHFEQLKGESKDWRMVREWLATELVQTCKQYRIAEATVILRLLILIGKKQDRVACDAVTYILSQQNSKGAFGFFMNDASESELLHVHLNWTLAALWAPADFAFSEFSISALFSVASYQRAHGQPGTEADRK